MTKVIMTTEMHSLNNTMAHACSKQMQELEQCRCCRGTTFHILSNKSYLAGLKYVAFCNYNKLHLFTVYNFKCPPSLSFYRKH